MFKDLINKIFPTKNINSESLKESIETVLESSQKGTESISKQERLMLLNILKIDEIRTIDIMIPRADIGAVEVNDSFEKVLEIFIKESHSRVPVYENNLDKSLG